MPALSEVLALYSLQNAMMLTPCCPRAGPTGGAGFALPAGKASLINATTFLAIAAVNKQVNRFFVAGRIDDHRVRKGFRDSARWDRKKFPTPSRRGIITGNYPFFSTWVNSSSTGVSRPKMESRALSLLRSGLTSITSPSKSLNGPDSTAI